MRHPIPTRGDRAPESFVAALARMLPEGTRFSLVAIVAADFVKIDGSWLVSNAMWTVEPEACDELRPADPSILRPAGPTE